MSRFRKLVFLILLIEILLLAGCNFLMLGSMKNSSGKQFRVDIARGANEMRAGKTPEAVVDKYPSIIRITPFQADKSVNNDYTVEDINGTLYRFEYQARADIRPLIFMNCGMGIAIVITLLVLLYVGRKILKPFNKMSNLSVELAKGNLSAPVKADKNKFFGRFLWGINMLRDNLETNKERELELQKDKKTLILSLSHDIKTPLSAIKLYARALDEDLYDTEEKRKEAIAGITHNAGEIERYVADIVTASKEDFLNLEVKISDLYLSDLMVRIETLYNEKFASLRTRFSVSGYENTLLSCDPDRLEEVIQNVLENAIKYGDGRWVRIDFDDEEDCRLITVTNSGCSIKEEEIPHLFESFYRGSNSTKVNGSGLGLYIARSLMRMMDGDIFAKCLPSKEEKSAGDFAVTIVVRKA